MLMIGYFEGLDSQRGIAWRCADSRSLAAFLGYGPTDKTPDHSSLSNTSNASADEAVAASAPWMIGGPRRQSGSATWAAWTGAVSDP